MGQLRGPLVALGILRGQGYAADAAPAPRIKQPERSMLYWAIVFLVIAIVAAAFGFGGIAAGAASIAKILFFVFIVLFLIGLVLHLMRRGPSA